MFSKAFVLAVAERAIKTFGQTAAAYIATVAASPLNFDWRILASQAGIATLLSVFTSIGSDAITAQPGPSLVSSEVLAPQ